MFVSVIPVLRTPHGVDVFDYRVDGDMQIAVGDLIHVPFRRRPTPALVAAISSTSVVASRAVTLTDVHPLIKFPATLPRLVELTARQTFSSQPTILAAWLRRVPKRRFEPFFVASTNIDKTTPAHSARTYLLTALRERATLERARSAHGRTLILTPWRGRAERYARELHASLLHADLADGAAWQAWTTFLHSDSGRLVATRIGAWLAVMADTVIIDEPENDDFKQDELSPRYDARQMVNQAAAIRPDLGLRFIGTTPTLMAFASVKLQPKSHKLQAPDISVILTAEPWQRRGKSIVSQIPETTFQRIQEAVEDGRPAVILHPIRGERARLVCRDCGWTAVCEACGFALSRQATGAVCRRCGHTQEVPVICPSCGGADLERSRIGKDALLRDVRQALPDGDIRVVDLGEWHALELPPKALVIVTDASLIGGYVEDIRRRERLAIAWRRLAAAVASVEGELIIHGPEELLPEMRAWLTGDGLERAWTDELRERAAFGYPPAVRLTKLLFDGDEAQAQAFADGLRAKLPETWQIRGPYAVPFRPKSRRARFVVHAVMPDGDASLLQPFAREAIIDLDPIAFFS